jgi:hypothetical protein
VRTTLGILKLTKQTWPVTANLFAKLNNKQYDEQCLYSKQTRNSHATVHWIPIAPYEKLELYTV